MGIFNKMNKEKAKKSEMEFFDNKGNGLDDAYAYLKDCKENGVNIYVRYFYNNYIVDPDSTYYGYGVRLYSCDVTTLENLYQDVYECSKEQYLAKRAEWQVEYEKRQAERREKIRKKIAKEEEERAFAQELKDSCYTRGEKIIFPSQKENWRACLNQRSLESLKDFCFTVKFMETLEESNDLNYAKDVMRHASRYDGIEMDKVLRFSKVGPEIYTEWKQISGKDMEKHADDKDGIYRVIDQIDQRNQEEIKLAKGLAKELHEDNRKSFMNKDGSYESCWKAINDEKFVQSLNPNQLPNNIRAVDGHYEIDIANSPYEQLSPDWQYENQEAGKVLAGLVIHSQYDNVNLSRKQIGDEIHNEWLKRNAWAKGGELDVPFDQLPAEVQRKDIAQYGFAGNYYEANVKKQPKFFDFSLEK